jgi:pilus assembly protein Flp/PilA
MNKFMQIAKQFVRDEEGATAIEYGLLAALVSVVIIGAVTLLGTHLSETFQSVADSLTGAGADPQ